MIDLVLLHIGQSLESAYVAALGGPSNVRVVRLVLGGMSASYDEDTGLAHDYPTLGDFVAARLPDHKSTDPLVVVAFSAGCWAPRAWMRDAASRKMCSVLVLLDGMHAGLLPDGTCNPAPLAGLLAYASLCDDQPQSHLFFLTHTAIDPVTYASTTKCAKLLEPYANPTSVGIFAYNGTDAAAHNQQQTTVGPQILEDAHAWLEQSWRPQPSGILGWIAAAAGAIVAGWLLGRGHPRPRR